MATSLRQAATNLGRLWYALDFYGERPIGSWIYPEKLSGRLIRPQLFAYVDTASGPDLPDRRALGQVRTLYRRDWALIVPRLQDTSVSWLNATLGRERDVVEMIGQRLLAPGVAVRLHDMAKPVMREVRGKGFQEAAPWQRPDETASQVIDRLKRRRLVWATSRDVPYSSEHAELFRLLVQHPHGFGLIEAFEESPKAGLDAALRRIADAIDSILELRGDIAGDPEHVWRYPPIILGGMATLGLADVPLFADFATALGAFLGKGWFGSAVEAAQMVLLCVGLVTGPVGLAVIGVLDLALTGATAVATYVREREQEMAASALAFAPQKTRLADEPTYRETALAGAATLVSSWMAWKGVTHALTDVGARAADRVAKAARLRAFEQNVGRAEGQTAEMAAERTAGSPVADSIGARGLDARTGSPGLDAPPGEAARLRERGTWSTGTGSGAEAGPAARTEPVAVRRPQRGTPASPTLRRRTGPNVPTQQRAAASAGAPAPSADALGQVVEIRPTTRPSTEPIVAGPRRRGTGGRGPGGRQTSGTSTLREPVAGTREIKNPGVANRSVAEPSAARGLLATAGKGFQLKIGGYGATPASLMAQAMRLKLRLRLGGNVAVFEFTELTEDLLLVLGNSRRRGHVLTPADLSSGLPDSFQTLLRGRGAERSNFVAFQNFSGFDHSEQLADRLIGEARKVSSVRAIYTEFSPCKEICLPILERRYPVDVTYSFRYEKPVRETWKRDLAVDELFATHAIK